MWDLLGVAGVYAGLLLLAAGLACLPRPPRRLLKRSRRRAAALVAAGPLLVLLGWGLPVRQAQHLASEQALLDGFVPTYQFQERHSVDIRASPDAAYRALRSVSADEVAFFRTLTFIRRMGHAGPESILNAPEKQPLLDVATRTSFLLLAEEPGREIVVGTLVVAPRGFAAKSRPTRDDFRRLAAPGFAKAAMNFRVEAQGSGARVTTETRVFATDAASARRFAAYWRVIYPGSALIRRGWLAAVRRRAEAQARSGG